MYRRGHTGIVLLALAPVLYALLQAGRPILALLACGVLVIEPLPDWDMRTSWLDHRGISHSFLTAGLIGVVCASLGWAVGTYVTVPVGDWLIATILVDPASVTWTKTHLLTLDAVFLAAIGFLVGAGGICLHLLGDIITISGIQPLLPFSQWEISLLPLRARNGYVNTGLFLLGWLAVGVALFFAMGLQTLFTG